MRAVLDIILLILDLYRWVLIAMIIMSWLISFNVINTRNQFVEGLWRVLNQLTEPVLRPIRRVMPNFSGLDISPIIAFVLLFFIGGMGNNGDDRAEDPTSAAAESEAAEPKKGAKKAKGDGDAQAKTAAKGEAKGAKAEAKAAKAEEKPAKAAPKAEGPAWLNTEPIQTLLERGREFGADMRVHLVNSGPVTFWLEV